MTVSVPKILVVDDNHHIRAMLMKALVHYGYQVTVAKDGFSGIEQLKKQKFDVILLDLQLPDITGHGFLRATANVSGRPPVIMISGEANQADVIEAFREHVADFVLKPFTIMEVVASLDKVFKHRTSPSGSQTVSGSAGFSAGQSDNKNIESPILEGESLVEIVNSGKIKLPRPEPFMDYISDMFEQSDMDTNSLVKLLEMNKDCASQIIHAAISKRHGGLHQALVDLPSAVKLLGTKKTLQILRVFILKITMQAPIEFLPEIFRRTWNNAMATASIARTLAENVAPIVTPDRAYVLAFLHNIGELLVLYLATIRSMKGEAVPNAGQIAQLIEETHGQLGQELCKDWDLSEEIRGVVSRHHDETLYSDDDSKTDNHLKQVCCLIILSYRLAIERDGNYLQSHPIFPGKQLCQEILGIQDSRLLEIFNSKSAVTAAQ